MRRPRTSVSMDRTARARGGLANQLEAIVEDERPGVHRIGDCLALRTVEEAVLEGLRLGHAL